MKYGLILLGLLFLGCVAVLVCLSQAGAKAQARQEEAMKK